MDKKKEDVMRLVEAMIAGNIDLSPQEMVDAAFIMVDKINERCGQHIAKIEAKEIKQTVKIGFKNGSI